TRTYFVASWRRPARTADRPRVQPGTASFLSKQPIDPLAHDALAFDRHRIQFARPAVADFALLVDQVDARPDLVVPVPPVLAVVVHHDGELQTELLGLGADLRHVGLAREFGGVDTDNGHALVRVLLLPRLVGRVIVDAIDAAERPEMHDRDLAAQGR